MRIGWKVQGHLLLIVVFALGCYGDRTADIDISIGNGEVAINIQSLGNPCEQQTCPDNQRCTSVYHPGLLDVPVAHCVPKEPRDGTHKDDPAECLDLKLGSNVMRCKTEKEWRDVGHTQCALRGGADRPLLADIQVAYACHSFGETREPVFLQARFTCCPWQPGTTQGSQDTKLQQLVQTEVLEGDDVDNEQQNVIMYPVIVAMAILVAALIIMVVLWQRRRSKQVRRHPKVIFATSFINPSADVEATPTYDTWDKCSGCSDKSLLIVNEQTQFSPGN